MSQALPAFLRRDWIDVGDGHVLHLAQYGNPNGIPLLYLHGGPGGGCAGEELKLFDRDSFRILMLDQRGAGRSRPKGELRHNDLQCLLRDIEAVRLKLNIESWCVVGGSYGATLGFIYSGLFPDSVISQVFWGYLCQVMRGLAGYMAPMEHRTYSLKSISHLPLTKLLHVHYRPCFVIIKMALIIRISRSTTTTSIAG